MKVEAIISKVLAGQHEQPRTSDSGSRLGRLLCWSDRFIWNQPVDRVNCGPIYQ